MTNEKHSLRTPTAAEWDERWAQADGATFFHSRHWAELWQRYSGGRIRPSAELVVFADGHSALLPFSVTRRLGGLLSVWESSPLGTFGGWITNDTLTAGQIALLHRRLAGKSNALWVSNPYDTTTAAEIPGPVSREETVTWAVDLRVGFEALYKQLNKARVPNKVRVAERHGLALKRLETADLTAMHRLYLDCQARWGASATNRYGPELFELLYATPHCELWGAATPEGELVSAGAFLRSKRHIAVWMGVAKTEALSMRPYDFLYYSMLQRCQQEGAWWFDFNPSGGHSGVDEFKRRFGANPLPCTLVRREDMRGRVLRKARERADRVRLPAVGTLARRLSGIGAP